MQQHPMRRKDRQTTDDQAFDILDRATYLTLSMADNAGNPYAVPLSFARKGSTLYFHCAMDGRKLDILGQRSQVCAVAVVDGLPYYRNDNYSTSFESVIVSGTASEVTDPETKALALTLLCEKYVPDSRQHIPAAISRSAHRTGVWAITIQSLTGKIHE